MKKTTLALFAGIVAISMLTVGCGAKYSDVKKATIEFNDIVGDFTADVEKVATAADAARALNDFSDDLEALMPTLLALGEKYPELGDKAAMPEELKSLKVESDKAGQDMVDSMMKLANYTRDPEVMKAQQRLSAIMSAR